MTPEPNQLPTRVLNRLILFRRTTQLKFKPTRSCSWLRIRLRLLITQFTAKKTHILPLDSAYQSWWLGSCWSPRCTWTRGWSLCARPSFRRTSHGWRGEAGKTRNDAGRSILRSRGWCTLK